MDRKFLVVLASLVVSLSGAELCAQSLVLPNANAGVAGGSNSNTLIRNVGNPRTYQAQIAASELAAIPAGTRITGMAFRLDTPVTWPAPPGATWANYELTLSQAANAIGSMSATFATNQLNPVLVRSGPLTIPAGSMPSAGNPIAFGFEVAFASHYAYLGGDLVITVRHTGSDETAAATFLDATASSPAGPVRAFSATSATAATGSSTSFTILRLSFVTEYQRSTPQADVNHDGVQTDGVSPAVITKCVNGGIVLNWNSTLAGMPHEALVTFAPMVPRSSPLSAPFSGQQVLNVDLAAPAKFFFWGGGPIPSMIPFFPFSVPFTAPAAPITWSAQMFILDPSMPGMLRLSQASQVDVIASGTTQVPGPSGDDVASAIALGAGANPCPAQVSFYGTAYTRLFVSTNGRVTFGSANTAFSASPSAAVSAQPFAGFWTDLMASAGEIICSLSQSEVRVAFTNVEYFGTTTSTSFDIRFSPQTGRVTIGNLGAMTPTPGGSAQLLGIANGTLGSSTVTPAVFPFGVAVSGAPGQALVDFWNGSTATAPNGVRLVGTVQASQAAAGLGLLEFTPLAGGYVALSQ